MLTIFSSERKNLPKLVNRKILTGLELGLITRNGTRPDAETVTRADAPQMLNRAARRSFGSIMPVVSVKSFSRKVAGITDSELAGISIVSAA